MSTGRFNGRHYEGYMRVLRELKREEAEARNAQTPDEKRKKNRVKEEDHG